MDSKTIKSIIDLINETDASNKDELIKSLQKLDKKSKKSVKAATEAMKKYREELNSNQTALKKQMKAELDLLETKRQLGLQAAAQIEDEKERKKVIDELNAATDKQIQQTKLQKEATDKVLKSTNKFMNSMGLGKDLGDSFIGNMILAGPRGFEAIATSIKDNLKPQKLFASGLVAMTEATKDLFHRFDQTASSLNRTTGASGEYNDMLYDLQESNKQFNVGVEEAGEAIKELHTQYSGFTELGKESQQQLAQTTARMQAFGGSIADTAASFDIMIQGMGMTTAEADKQQMELLALSNTIKVGLGKIQKDFTAASSELAKYGPQAVEVFKGVAAAAKATGIEVGKLMGLTKQFDTFEGAATAAGKLNAILGGGVINSMDLLNATEEERVRLLIQSVAASGKSYANMNKFEKQALANAAGITDMTEANKLFTMSLSEYDAMQRKAAEGDMSADEMERRAAAAQSFADKLKRIKEAFAVAFLPVLEGVRFFLDMLLNLNDMTGGMLMPTLVGLAGVIFLISKYQTIANIATAASTGLQAAKALVTGGLSAAQSVLAGTTAATGASEAAATPPTIAFAGALTSVSVAAAPLVPAIAGLGFAIGGLGLAIAAPFIALAALVTAFKEVFIALLKMPEAMGEATAGILLFAAASAAGMMILAVGLAGAVTILTPFALQMGVIALPLAKFAGALALAALPMLIAAKALEMLGTALQTWAEVEMSSILKAVFALGIFAGAMILIGLKLGVAAALVGPAILLLGVGLKQLSAGIISFQDVTGDQMARVVQALAVMALGLLALSVPLFLVGVLVGIGLIPMAMGLKSFADAMQAYSDVSKDVNMRDLMREIVESLAFFTLMMIPLVVPLTVINLLIGLSLMALAFGLKNFAQALVEFDTIGDFGQILKNATEAIWFAAGNLLLAAPGILLAGIFVGIPLLLLAIGLKQFALAMDEFSFIGQQAIPKAVETLKFLTDEIGMGLAVKIMLLGLFVALPLLIFALALGKFAEGIAEFNTIGPGAIQTMVTGLTYLADEIGYLGGLKLAAVFGAVSIPLFMFAMGLMKFAEALFEFNYITGAEIDKAISGLFGFLEKMGMKEAFVAKLMGSIGIPLYKFAVGLWAFGTALGKFNDITDTEIDTAIGALEKFLKRAKKLPVPYTLSMVMGRLGFGLMQFGVGISELAGNEDTMNALGNFLLGLGAVAGMSVLSLMGIGSAIHYIINAMENMPESKGVTFSATMKGLAPAVEAATALTPEVLENTKEFVDQQVRMARAQTEQLKAEAYAAQMQGIFGGLFGGRDKKEGGQGKKEVVLELNDREFGRAVIDAIEGKYNLKTE